MISQPAPGAARARLNVIDLDLERALGSWIQARHGEMISYATHADFMSADSAAQIECVLAKVTHNEKDLRLVGRRSPQMSNPSVIYIVGGQDVEYGIYLLKQGAADVLADPHDFPRLTQAISQAWERCARLKARWAESALCRKRLAALTKREREVLKFLLKGLLNKQVAAELNICENTVKAHRKKIMSKTGVCSLVKLARWMERAQVSLVYPSPVPAEPAGLRPSGEPLESAAVSNGQLRAA